MKIVFYFMLISSFAKSARLILIINNKYLNNFNQLIIVLISFQIVL